MLAIDYIDSGILYRNPIPHIKSRHAYFPSIIRLGNGNLLAAIVLGEAFEAVDLHTYIARSIDGGVTWKLQGEIIARTKDRETSDCARLTMADNGEVIAFLVRYNRSRNNQGLANPENLGFVETELLLLRSNDYGYSWGEPELITPPLEGPSFEMCSPVTCLSDGRWIIPTSTWHSWDGYCPDGIKMVSLISNDKGKTWPYYWNIMQQHDNKVFFWESKVLEMEKGCYVAVAWGYDRETGKDLSNQYSISYDGGKTFTLPLSTDLNGQTLTPLLLNDGRILSVYRRVDKAGLWANISHIDSGKWINDYEYPLWGYSTDNGHSNEEDNLTDKKMVQNFNKLRFGAPGLIYLDNETVLITFWAVEDCVSNIRWIKIKVY